MNLIFSDKYSKVYRDGSHLKGALPFTVFLYNFLCLLFSFPKFFWYGSKTDLILYIQIITFLIFFVLSKYLIEKIIATAFHIEDFVEQFNLQKVT
jgi:hypothetical protein